MDANATEDKRSHRDSPFHERGPASDGEIDADAVARVLGPLLADPNFAETRRLFEDLETLYQEKLKLNEERRKANEPFDRRALELFSLQSHVWHSIKGRLARHWPTAEAVYSLAADGERRGPASNVWWDDEVIEAQGCPDNASEGEYRAWRASRESATTPTPTPAKPRRKPARGRA